MLLPICFDSAQVLYIYLQVNLRLTKLAKSFQRTIKEKGRENRMNILKFLRFLLSYKSSTFLIKCEVKSVLDPMVFLLFVILLKLDVEKLIRNHDPRKTINNILKFLD
jgi:hypothetical protein